MNRTYNRQRQGYHKRLALLAASLVVFTFLSLLFGRYPSVGFVSLDSLLNDPLMGKIVVNIRMPRIILAILGGASLAAAGFVFQMLFANPLVEPGFLGVSQGAAFGAAAVIVFYGYSSFYVQLSATFFALLALYLSYRIAHRFRFGGWILRLVLSGIAVGAIFSSLLSVVKVLADPTTSLQEITFWMMGGLYNSTWERAVSVIPTMMISLIVLFSVRWRINLLSLPDRTGHTLGLSVVRERIILLIVATVATTSIISVAGLVSWVGLIVPHLARRLFTSDSRYSLAGSMMLGALFLLISDTLGRTLLSSEIPLGIITSLFGAILFIFILSSRQSGVKL
ncbi:MAG: iron ABC transporter permease [Sphaerochaetaceae bacterium]|nr:iron ABC transporter permease [Sphaerochaetaceae bacterium]